MTYSNLMSALALCRENLSGFFSQGIKKEHKTKPAGLKDQWEFVHNISIYTPMAATQDNNNICPN